ncbi:hypothetical protein ACXZAQ_21785 [Citrobacter portucalensis]|jgi:hypothetical protein|uniref:hypothetical protein n=1 Tax=Citrobacter freundii complex TaxID=1344959 RepID=UPI0015EA3CFB|nr:MULTISPECIES: hypothetical protein [Citrobacter]MBE0067102.1 hypothetical protein [Citrobacter freundii]MBJ8362709.1 hypothetical protein [Citrobacter cronae]QLR76432.1 hypothetical protein HV336_05815 [Citrobacter freundii]HEE9861366.1 hypothetical protein [Citrobacter freundii]
MKECDVLASEHAWRYFELHAQQRIAVFNFYIAITGLLAAGIGFSLQQEGKYLYLCSILGFFMIFISIIFWKLDHRVSMLIKNAETALQCFENNFQDQNFRILTKDKNDKHLNTSAFSNWSYGKCFRIAFIFVGNIGLAFVFIPIILFLIK